MRSEQEIRAYMDDCQVGVLDAGNPGPGASLEATVGFATAMAVAHSLAWVLGEEPEDYVKELVERMATFAAEVRAASARPDLSRYGSLDGGGATPLKYQIRVRGEIIGSVYYTVEEAIEVANFTTNDRYQIVVSGTDRVVAASSARSK